MIKKYVLTTIILSCIITCSCFAAFEYEGTFAAERKSNDPQTYYILLNENNKVLFSLKGDKGVDSKDVFISKIKLSSDETIVRSSESGISEFVVPVTGIYEVEVKTNEKLSNPISYKLKVDEEKKNSNNSSVSEKPEIVINEEEVKQDTILNAGKDIHEISNTSNSTTTFVETVTSSSVSTSTIKFPLENEITTSENRQLVSNQISTDSADLEQIQDAETFYTTTEPLGPDTSAIEVTDTNEPKKEVKEAETISEPEKIIKKAVNFDCKIQLIKSVDIYDFVADKNKCWPKSICYDETDKLWVLDGQLNKIHCYDKNGSEMKAFGSKGKENFALGIPVSIACFQNKLLVGDRQKHCIHIFDYEGKWISAIQSNPTVGLKITNPVSICIRNNEIWVGDSGTNRMLCFDASFTFLGSFGSTKEGKIESIAAVATDGSSIFILEEEGCIKRFGPMGNFEAAFATEISFGSSMFVDTNKNIWVVDNEKGGVNCYSNEGKTLYSITRNKLKDLLENSDKFSPSAISISNEALIAITDTYSKQIKIFELQ